jgi:class 3 adenylate cyclase
LLVFTRLVRLTRINFCCGLKDIVGFTAWSSERSPVDVFTLLETIYGRFDELAQKRGVFKVETIGDCYVAVTGVPQPRKDHAVVMAKFARDLLQTLEEELLKLVPVLGEETTNLAMRVGKYLMMHVVSTIRPSL